MNERRDPHFDQACEALNLLRDVFHGNAKAKCFHDEHPLFLQLPEELQEMYRQAVMQLNSVGEISEAWEAVRKRILHKPCDKAEKMLALTGETLTNEEEEAADLIIRALDYAGRFNIDISKAVRIKHTLNVTRPERHGGKIA